MAFSNNRRWLLSHVRNSFTASDRRGIREARKIPKHTELFPNIDTYGDSDENDDDADMSSSLENYREWGFENHTIRGPLPGECEDAEDDDEEEEEEEEERMSSDDSRHGRKGDEAAALPEQHGDLTFERKEVKKNRNVGRSLLSFQLEQCSLLPRNPFCEYAKYEGNSGFGVPTRTYKIFLTMLPPSERNYPIQVCIIRSAKVSDLVGLTCWKYKMENPESSLHFKEDVSEYGLFIAEDDGEVDWDLSSLDAGERIGKFCFEYLALAEMPEKKVSEEVSMVGEDLNSEEALASALRKKAEMEATERFTRDLCAMKYLSHESFLVSMLRKKRGKYKVILRISGDKIRIDPDVEFEGRYDDPTGLRRSLSFNMDEIVACEVLETAKPPHRTTFRIINCPDSFSGYGNYKNNDFECDTITGDLIIKKINAILEIKGGVRRKAYLESRPKKRGKRTFRLWPR